jgi:hypothetical protein
MTISDSDKAPPILKRSRAKIWIRTGILAVFGSLFGLTIYQDILAGAFNWVWALTVFLLCLPVGFWMRKFVPMQVHPASRHVTLSFDRVYFIPIVLLVIVKAVAGNILSVTVIADFAMCIILGLMIGRLGGIGLRVRNLKRNM